MVLKKIIFPFLIILFVSGSAFSREYLVENINIKDGLPNSLINCMIQDTKGFLWIGTSNGLCRYDGYKFELFPVNHLSTDEDIIGLKLSKEGDLWILLRSGELAFFNVYKEKFEPVRIEATRRLPNATTIEIQNDSILWAGTRRGLVKIKVEENCQGAITLKPGEKFFPRPRSSSNNNNFITCLKTNYNGNDQWVGTNGNLFLFNFATKQFKLVSSAQKWSARNIFNIDNNNVVVSFWNSGIAKFDDNGNKISDRVIDLIDEHVNHQKVTSFLKESEKSYWVGTRENGLFNFIYENDSLRVQQFRFNPENKTSLGSNAVSCLLQDHSKVIWAGMLDEGGLNKITGDRYQLDYIPETFGMIVNSILAKSKNKLWLATSTSGLVYMNLKTGQKTVMNQGRNDLGYNNATILHEDNAHNIWVGTYGNGVRIIPRETVEKIENNLMPSNLNIASLTREIYPGFQNYITDICSDREGRVWMATAQALFSVMPENNLQNINKDRWQISNYFENDKTLQKLSILSLYPDTKGYLWIATESNGLIRINQENTGSKELTEFNTLGKDGRTILSNKVFHCYQDESDFLWVVSANGLDKINLNDLNAVPVITKEQAGNNQYQSITIDKSGKCWIGMDYGICCYNPENNELVKYYRPSVYGNFTQYRAMAIFSDGTIYMGTRNGITRFNPGNIKNEKLDIPFYITSIKINNNRVIPGEKVTGRKVLGKNIDETKRIILKSTDHHIEFEVASLDFLDRSLIEYKYMLENASKNWNKLGQGQHSLSFTNLRKGDYILHIKAVNLKGAWKPKEIQLAIKVLPPFWQSKTAILVYSLLLLGLLYLFRRYSIIREKEKNELRLVQIEKEKSEELNNLKLQFFTNISHEFRTPLSLILSPLEILIDKTGDPETSQQLGLIQRNAKRLLFLVNQIIDIRKLDAGKLKLKPQNINLSEFANQVFVLFQSLAKKKNIRFTIEKSREEICVNIDTHYLESVIYNILSNAFRFTCEGGTISLEIYKSNEYACIAISDTGRGIPADKIDMIFERFYHSDEAGKEWTGAGIGLSFSKSIVDLHNGDILVESREGEGSAFTVRLPLNGRQVPIEEYLTGNSKTDIGLDTVIFEEYETGREPAKLNTGGKKEFSILVVEDNPDLRTFISEQLKPRYYVYDAENGKTGWEMIQNKQPDLVVTDLMMPEMNGLELCNLIKSTEQFSHIPVIILTARNLEEDRMTGYKTGADAYIFKPFQFRYLLLRIENLLTLKTKFKDHLKENLYIGPNIKTDSRDKIFIEKTIALVEENIGNSGFNVDDMYKPLGYSRTNFYRKIKDLTGFSAKEFVREVRLQYAAQMFRENDITVNEASYSSGFESTSYFSKCFKNRFNQTPLEYKTEHYARHEKTQLIPGLAGTDNHLS